MESNITCSSDLFTYIHKDIDIVTLCCQICTIFEFVNVPSHFLNLVGVKRKQFVMLQRDIFFTEQRMHRQQWQARVLYSSFKA